MGPERAGPGGRALSRGTLAGAVRSRSERARRSGALETWATEGEIIEDAGVPFVVHLLVGAERPRNTTGASPNPFLPYDPELFVADVSQDYVCLLNKYCIAPGHLLLVTRDFEEQQEPLGARDFEALWTCMAELDGLGFYNAGALAGASQRHRHLQLVPVPLGAGPERTPIDAALEDLRFDGAVGTAPRLPFLHAVARLRACATQPPGEAAPVLAALYHEMLRAFGCEGTSLPYNLLVTRDWMLFVPRTRERWQGISVNALGFAGSLLVRSRDELERVRRAGPMALLRHVAVAREG